MPVDLAMPEHALASHRPVDAGTPCAALRELLAALGDACELAPATMARQVSAALSAAAARPDLLTESQRMGSSASYRRHILAADPHGRFTIVSLVWWAGQHSPVHAHHTWCGYAVVEGTLSETCYDWQDGPALPVAASTHARRPGAVSFTDAGRCGTHTLGNDGAAPAISLHVYGVAAEHVSTRVNECAPATLRSC